MLPWNTCGDTQDLVRIPIQPSSIEYNFMSHRRCAGEGELAFRSHLPLAHRIKTVRVVNGPKTRTTFNDLECTTMAAILNRFILSLSPLRISWTIPIAAADHGVARLRIRWA